MRQSAVRFQKRGCKHALLPWPSRRAWVVFNDARTGMPPGIPGGAMCVQRFDDSLNSAIHTTYRISLRSSSMREPRDPLLKVLTFVINIIRQMTLDSRVNWLPSTEAPSGCKSPEWHVSASMEATGKVLRMGIFSRYTECITIYF